MRHKARRIKHGGLSRHIFEKDKPSSKERINMSKTAYSIIYILAMPLAAACCAYPLITLALIAVGVWAAKKGGLFDEELTEEDFREASASGDSENAYPRSA